VETSYDSSASIIIPEAADQRVFLRDVSWDQYQSLLAMRGEGSSVRTAYLEGVMELMSPSREHEMVKKMLARLLEAYAEEAGIELESFGSWTIKDRSKQRGAEPDECYSVGEAAEVPDLAIEVVWTKGGLEKLELYTGLGVREVWIWKQRRIQAYVLRGSGYEPAARSELLPDLDLDLLAKFVRTRGHTSAVREFRAALRRGTGGTTF